MINPSHFLRKLFYSRSPSGQATPSEASSKIVDPKKIQERVEEVAPGNLEEISAQISPSELWQHLEQGHQTMLTSFEKESRTLLTGLQGQHLTLLERILINTPSLASSLHQQHQNAIKGIQEQHIQVMKEMKQAHSDFLRTIQEKKSVFST